MGFAKYGRQNIALNTFGILIGFCTLAVVNEKVTAKQATGILMPVLRKAPNVPMLFNHPYIKKERPCAMQDLY
jgi:hypothetical protein